VLFTHVTMQVNTVGQWIRPDRRDLPVGAARHNSMAGWLYADDDVDGGVLAFDFRLELHVCHRLDEDEPMAVWDN
jgi:hypothetical protein